MTGYALQHLRQIVGGLGMVLMLVALIFIPHWSPRAEGAVTKVSDGDTIWALREGEPANYRQLGLNAPEDPKGEKNDECLGPEATEFAAEFFTGKTVTAIPDPTQDEFDRWGRRLVYLEVDGKDYGLAVITAGLAVEKTYDGKYERQARYRAAEKYAQLTRRGIWGSPTTKECR